MKTAHDPRHQRRIHVMQELFALSFHDPEDNTDIQVILPHLPGIDEKIGKAAPEWPIDKIAKIDLAILRLAIFELVVQKTEPPKVIIDEAVELGKEFGNPSTSSFVNGVLGTIYKEHYDTPES